MNENVEKPTRIHLKIILDILIALSLVVITFGILGSIEVFRIIGGNDWVQWGMIALGIILAVLFVYLRFVAGISNMAYKIVITFVNMAVVGSGIYLVVDCIF
ncbi:MAG: hypothetical protein ACTSPO_16080 [Candidatus Heimdallarchaeaceae archaeon]